MIAAFTGAFAIVATTAEAARLRASNAAKAAAVTSSPETSEARQDAHQENQNTRKDRREDASPNQKAAAYNVTKTRHNQKTAAAANVAAKRTTK